MAKHTHNTPDLDHVVAAIRDAPIDPAAVAAAATRVRATLAAAPTTSGDADATLRDCADIQALLPVYLRRELSPARLLLIEDHTRACIPCRRALITLRTGATAATPLKRTWRIPSSAAAALVVGLLGASTWFALGLRDVSGAIAEIKSTEGTLFTSTDGTQSTAAVGTTLNANEEVRTAKGSGAVVQLADGSLIELAERTALSISSRRAGQTIQLTRGNIIVQAAKQRDGHLFVATRDCLVSVTGTIFAVNHGTKGSRVSVIEGSVAVDSGTGEQMLAPGQQVSSHPSLGTVPVRDEIAWSRDVDRYLGIMSAFVDIGREIQERIVPPAPRGSSRLLALVPAQTVVYAAVPNVGRSVADAYSIFRVRMQQNNLLKSWWQEHSGDDSARLDQLIGQLRELGSHLGDELVFVVPMTSGGGPEGVVLMAEATNPQLLRLFLNEAITRLHDTDRDDSRRHAAPHEANFAVVDALDTAGDRGDLLAWVRDDGLVLVGPRAALAAFAPNPDAVAFTTGTFHQRIAQAYGNGVNWLFAADLATIIKSHPQRSDNQLRAWEKTGLADLEHVLFEERSEVGVSHKQAVMTFDQPRRGLASWLAEPAPMSTLDFVSPDAAIAGAFVVKDPKSMLDDVLESLQMVQPDLIEQIEKLELEHGIRIRDDIAAPLGGEVALALDGPLLPEPSWKLVVEVYDAERLQTTVRSIIERVDIASRRAGKLSVALTEESRDGRMFFGLRLGDGALPLHWVVVDGYLIAGPSVSVVDNSIRYRDSGITLARSRVLTDLFPDNGLVNFSGLVFHNVKALLANAAELVGSRVPLNAEQKAALQDITRDASAELYYAYAQPDRITIAGSGRGGLLGMDLSTLIRLNGIMGLGDALGNVLPGSGAGQDGTGQQDAEPNQGVQY